MKAKEQHIKQKGQSVNNTSNIETIQRTLTEGNNESRDTSNIEGKHIQRIQVHNNNKQSRDTGTQHTEGRQ